MCDGDIEVRRSGKSVFGINGIRDTMYICKRHKRRRRRSECERGCGGVGRGKNGVRVWRKEKTAFRWWERHGNGTRSGMGIWIGNEARSC